MLTSQELDARWVRNAKRKLERVARKRRAVQACGGACQICGYSRCLDALEFHHVDPNEKDLEISSSTSWAKIEAELKRCTLLCATCHREVHAGMHPSFLVDRFDPTWAGV